MKKLKIILRVLIAVVSAGMIYWYLISAIVTVGSIFGILFFLMTGLAAVLWDKIEILLRKIKKKKWRRIVLRIVEGLFGAGAIYISVVLCLMLNYALIPPEENATVVVLGCQVNGDVPSLMLSRRIAAAKEYLEAHPNVKCIVSGGKGNHENISEAECMYRELVKQGIDASRIYKEDRSTNTQENIAFSGEIIAHEGLDSRLALVTDGFHEMRASIICSKQGYECGSVPAKTPLYLAANFTTREVLALTAEFIGI